MRIRVTIERVVVHGVAVDDVPRFRAALAAELSALVSAPGVAASLASGGATTLALPALPPAAGPEALGRACAQRIVGGLA